MSHPEPRIDVTPLIHAGYEFVLKESNTDGRWKVKGQALLMTTTQALADLERRKVNLNKSKVMKRPAWEGI